MSEPEDNSTPEKIEAWWQAQKKLAEEKGYVFESDYAFDEFLAQLSEDAFLARNYYPQQ